MGVGVSVLLVVHNEESLIEKAIASILNQSCQDFELIIIDDGSTDATYQKIAPYLENQKVFCFRNEKNTGIAYSRNRAWQESKGDLVFFIDADCMATRYWIQEGLEMMQKRPHLAGLEGITYYENALATVSNQVTQVLSPGQFQCCNMVYRRFVWEKSGGFDESFRNYGEDSDFAKRVLTTCGEIGFDKDLIVIHQDKKRKLEAIFIRYKDRVSSQALYEVRNSKRNFVVMNPRDLLITFFPFFLLCYHRFKKTEDIKYAFFLYCAIVYSRFCIWKLAIRNKKWIL